MLNGFLKCIQKGYKNNHDNVITLSFSSKHTNLSFLIFKNLMPFLSAKSYFHSIFPTGYLPVFLYMHVLTEHAIIFLCNKNIIKYKGITTFPMNIGLKCLKFLLELLLTITCSNQLFRETLEIIINNILKHKKMYKTLLEIDLLLRQRRSIC